MSYIFLQRPVIDTGIDSKCRSSEQNVRAPIVTIGSSSLLPYHFKYIFNLNDDFSMSLGS